MTDAETRGVIGDAASPDRNGRFAGAMPKHTHRLRLSALGMGAEILYACGLILVGFLISLLSGW